MQAAHGQRWEPIYVDLWGQPDPLGAVNTALAGALREVSTAGGRTPVTGVGVLGVSIGLAAPAALAAPTEPAALLASQFSELVRLRPGKPALLMLDEAQVLVRPGAGDTAMKAIRALFNSHPGAILLVFTGSSKPQLMSLVGDHSKTAFKLAAHMDFPALGIAFIAFVARRYREITGREVAVADFDWAFGQLLQRPGEMIDFVRFLITETPGAGVREALVAFKERNRPDRQFQEQFTACTPLQQAVLLEVAAAAKLFAKEARERIGRRLGQPGAVAPASVHNALAQLETRNLLVKSIQRGHYLYEDEQMRQWVHQVARQVDKP
jgi:hypothetical protein